MVGPIAESGLAVLSPKIISVVGSGRWSGSATYIRECDGPFKTDTCMGPLVGRVQVKVIGGFSETYSHVFKDFGGCSPSSDT